MTAPYRLAINGFGRIGRSVLRALYESGRQQAMTVVAMNFSSGDAFDVRDSPPAFVVMAETLSSNHRQGVNHMHCMANAGAAKVSELDSGSPAA